MTLKGYDDNKVFKEQKGLLIIVQSVQDHKLKSSSLILLKA